MDSSPSPIPVISEIIEGGKRNFVKSLELSKARVNELRLNVARNVQTLKGNGAMEAAADQLPPSFTQSCATDVSAEVPGRASASALQLQTWGEVSGVETQAWKPMPTPFNYSGSSSSSGPFPAEESPSLSTVSATSVFDIGSIGSPLLGPESNDIGKTTPKADSCGAPPMTSAPSPQRAPLVELNDVREFVGNAITVWRKVRALGLRESSWENKMPWRNPRPSYLAKGLQCPPEEFSSEREKHEYYRRARRRGRYLIGPTPTWSFIVADVALLYFLIANPAGNFLR